MEKMYSTAAMFGHLQDRAGGLYVSISLSFYHLCIPCAHEVAQDKSAW